MSNGYIHRNWRGFRREHGFTLAPNDDFVGKEISRRVTTDPGFIYTSDHEQPAKPEVGLPGGQAEAVRSHHKDILAGRQPLGDCDDFTQTGCQLMYLAGIDARRILKIMVADQNQFYYRGFDLNKLRLTHIVAGLYLGDLPDSLNVADMLARDENRFKEVRWLCDTFDQAYSEKRHTPMVMCETGEYNRHLPVSLSSLGTGLAQYAIKGSEHILRNAGFMRADGSIAIRADNFPRLERKPSETDIVIDFRHSK